MSTAPLLLTGFRILDLCRLAATVTTKLADLGAEVIKVEEPVHGDTLRQLPPILDRFGAGLLYLMANRNKKSLALDVKSDEGRAIFSELVGTADAVVEISKPGTFERLELDYASLQKVKPDLVYCSLTGFGQTGPLRMLPSHGMNIDAAGGLLRIKRGPGGRPEIAIGSALGLEMGSTHAALAVVAALLARSRTGEGCYLDVSCWDAAAACNLDLSGALNLGSVVNFDNPLKPGGPGPKYNVYGTKDDKVILLCPIEPKFWVAFCDTVGRPDWASRRTAAPMDYGESDPGLRDDIETVMRTRTLDDWMDTLLASGVPAAPVLTADDLVDHPHAEGRRLFTQSADERYEGLWFVRPPVLVDGADFQVALPPPVLGEHSDEILAGLGHTVEDRARVRAAGVIATPG